MKLRNRKSKLPGVLGAVSDSLDVPSRIKARRPGAGAGKALKKVGLPKDLPKDKAVKAGLVAGGLAGLTAGSAGISSLRRRQEGTDDS